MKTTAVSRFNTAVTAASSSSRPAINVNGPPGTRATVAPPAAKTPSRAATAPTSSRPATSANAGHACENAAWASAALKRSAEERLRDAVPVGRHRFELGGRLLERHRDDVVALQRGHLAELR